MRNLSYLLVACLFILSGCAQHGSAQQTQQRVVLPKVTQTPVQRTEESIQQDIEYYIERLAERDFVDTYGDDDNPKTWYTAAEALGWIGKPAVPHLMERLDSSDPYELMLALYALQLATQDDNITWQTDGEYVRLSNTLDPAANARNRAIALAWWQRHGHIWDAR